MFRPILTCGWLLVIVASGVAQDTTGRSDVEAALGTVFSPRRAPAERKMGLLQRSFLDLVEASQPRLEIALVIDGTDSMGKELHGLQRILGQMVADLQRHRQAQVFFQLVVYRDAGAAGGEVAFPLPRPDKTFTNDVEQLAAAIGSIQQESGAPYFPELVDLGVSEAITKLNWSQDEGTTRWILLFGDAPPFEEGFAEPETQARRRIATDQLVATANRNKVTINCVLCQSSPENTAAFTQVLDETRDFFNELATQTNGLMLDLSYSDIRNAVHTAAAAEDVGYQRIGKITQEDVDAAREQAAQARLTFSAERRMRAAVLPHMPLDRISFDPARDEVQFSAELRCRLRAVSGIELKSPKLIERQLEFLKARGVRGATLLQMLGSALHVDYIFWGSFQRQGNVLVVETSVYDVTSGEPVVAETLRTPSESITKVCGQIASNLMDRATDQQQDQLVAATFGGLPPAERRSFVVPVAQTGTARRSLLMGFESLEQALAFNPDETSAQRLLEQARTALEEAIAEDTTNPIAYWLLASCYFNQAQVQKTKPATDESPLNDFSRALNNAYRFRGESELGYIKREIEADYCLQYSKEYDRAISIYEELANAGAGSSQSSALRAHWMLAGIFSGDWGIAANAEQLIDPERARKHLIQILAHWHDSSEAAFIRKNLRWSEDRSESRYEHFPRSGQPRAPREV